MISIVSLQAILTFVASMVVMEENCNHLQRQCSATDFSIAAIMARHDRKHRRSSISNCSSKKDDTELSIATGTFHACFNPLLLKRYLESIPLNLWCYIGSHNCPHEANRNPRIPSHASPVSHPSRYSPCLLLLNFNVSWLADLWESRFLQL